MRMQLLLSATSWKHLKIPDFDGVDSKIWLIMLKALLLVFVPLQEGQAQHPIEVQQKAANGEYFQALSTYDRMARRKATSLTVLAAARSAWALSLPDRAISEYEKALGSEDLSPKEKARAYLSRSIIEYQEDRYRVAALYAEKTISMLPAPSPLRAHAWLIWGESLYELDSFGAAEAKYETALIEATLEARPDIHYRLGLCQLRLGNLESARSHFQQVPLSHPRTADAIRHLAHIALDQGSYDHALFWLEKGRSEFPDEFLDSWVDYALVRASLQSSKPLRARKIQENAQKKYPPSDYWLTMLNATLEVDAWQATR